MGVRESGPEPAANNANEGDRRCNLLDTTVAVPKIE